ncbi:MAG: hypothetical protein MJ238_06205 [Bacilli bacterium]|nr:hypothetical protein [Bacilli bacterium]
MANKEKKTIWEFVKFVLVSCIVSIIQLILVNALFFLMKGWTAPLPSFLGSIFTEDIMGVGHNNWGYILPFFLSNLIANVYGFFQNRKTTFHSDSPIYLVVIYIVIVFVLILISTWLQGLVANLLISTGVGFLVGVAPTVAAMVAGTFQMVVLFPIEKFVLFKK